MSKAIVPPEPPTPVDYTAVMLSISALIRAVSVELGTVSVFKQDSEATAMHLLHDSLGQAHQLAHLVTSIRRETGVTAHDVRARLALSHIEAVLGA